MPSLIQRTAPVALYKYGQTLSQSQDEAFDSEHEPGAVTPLSGIYRCTNCGEEVASPVGTPLPPHNHRPHDILQGRVRWQLLVSTQQVGSSVGISPAPPRGAGASTTVTEEQKYDSRR